MLLRKGYDTELALDALTAHARTELTAQPRGSTSVACRTKGARDRKLR